MFTLEEIKTAHKIIKSGADFPAYVASLRGLGVDRYESFVVDGHPEYYGLIDFKVVSETNYPALEIAPTGDKLVFWRLLQLH